jgi:Ca2+-binding EF-hand superfamily protein
MSTLVEELEQTHEALKVILEDPSTFNYVVGEVFPAIDKDRSGNLGVDELKAFVVKVCQDMGMKTQPDSTAINEVFKDLDEDNSDSVSQEEFGRFLRRLFITQKDECAKALSKK